MTPSDLRTQIEEHFNKSELEDICFDLSIKYDNLRGDTLNDKCRELVGYCSRHGQMERLIHVCQNLRPHLKWDSPSEPFSKPIEVGSNHIQSISRSNDHLRNTPETPLLVGIVLDLSRPMLNVLLSTQEKPGFSRSRFRHSIDLLLEKIVASCKTPESDEILPRLEMFIYGYGFGQIRKRLNSFLQRIGVESSVDIESIPTAEVRDLFSEAHESGGHPLTPNASELNLNLKEYQQSIESQFLDMGMGKSNLYEGILAAFNRCNEELKRPHHTYSVLFLISTGQLEDGVDEQLSILIHDLQVAGVIIACCYVGSKDLFSAKRLYVEKGSNWTQEAKRLFYCSSAVSSEHETAKKLIEVALEKGWEVPEHSRLFIQLNDRLILNEFTEIIFSILLAE